MGFRVVTFQELRDFDPGPYQALGDSYRRLSRLITDRAEALTGQAQRLSWHWEGKAYDAAAARLAELRRGLADLEKPLNTIDVTLSGAVDDLLRAQGMLLDALADAAKIPASVSDDGEVVTYTGPELDKERRIAAERRMSAVLDDIDAALAVAERADRAGADALRKLVPGYDPTDPSRGKLPVSEIPKPGADPEAVHRWWESLTPEQQQYLIHHHPGRIGNLDGVPILARDQANRTRLAYEHERAAARRDEIRDRLRELERVAQGDDTSAATRAVREITDLERELALVERNLRGMTAIETRLYEPKPGQPEAYLVGFEPGTKAADDGRAIVAIGNPDTADHVATYVPGTGADLDSVGGDIKRADTMALDTRRMAPGEDTSVVLWLGYDAPDSLGDAGAEKYAEQATGDLRRFQEGLRATHYGPPSHNTVLGHSYGSTVIGYTAHDAGISADELVFVGSPGVGVDHAYELNGVSPDHVWATRAQYDVIWAVPDLWFGEDPSQSDFGGQVFSSNPGSVFDQLRTHSNYWDDSNLKARDGMAGIITGRYEEVPGYVARQPPPGPTPEPSPAPAATPPR